MATHDSDVNSSVDNPSRQRNPTTFPPTRNQQRLIPESLFQEIQRGSILMDMYPEQVST